MMAALIVCLPSYLQIFKSFPQWILIFISALKLLKCSRIHSYKGGIALLHIQYTNRDGSVHNCQHISVSIAAQASRPIREELNGGSYYESVVCPTHYTAEL